MGIGENIKRIRKEKGMTLKQLADNMGCSPQLVSQYETGKRIPKSETIIRISRALNIDFLELADDESSKLMKMRRDNEDLRVYGEIKKRTFKESVEELEASQKYFENEIRSLFYSFSDIGSWGQTLEEHYQLLNDEGKKKADNEMKHAVEQVELLTKIPEYRKTN